MKNMYYLFQILFKCSTLLQVHWDHAFRYYLFLLSWMYVREREVCCVVTFAYNIKHKIQTGQQSINNSTFVSCRYIIRVHATVWTGWIRCLVKQSVVSLRREGVVEIRLFVNFCNRKLSER